MVQILPTGEISFWSTVGNNKSDYNIGYIYTFDEKYNEELKQRQKIISFLQKFLKQTVTKLLIPTMRTTREIIIQIEN